MMPRTASDTDSDPVMPLGRRARKAQAARQALFAAGLAAFDRQPIGMVSVLDITEAADVAKGVFYLHFDSKDEYLLSLLAETHRRLLDGAARQAAEARSERARREAVIRSIRAFAVEHADATRFLLRMGSYLPDDVGRPGQLAGARDEYRARLASILAGREGDAAATCRAEKAAGMLDAACWGLIGAAMRHGEPVGPEDLFVRAASGMVRSAAESAG
jgi:AcrR family transcriptional regulator